MRGTHTRKRSRPQVGGARKRRRFVRRKRRVSRKTTNWTTQSGRGNGLNFRSRRLKGRQWRSILWRDTVAKQHYRSNSAVLSTFTTPADAISYQGFSIPALRFGGNTFYTTAGGAIAPDSAQVLPVFTGDTIIRGGMIGMKICNNVDSALVNTGEVFGDIFLVRTTKNYVPGALPANPPVGWEPTLVQDFDTKIGRILYNKKFILKDADAFVCEYRLRVTKVDPGDYVNNLNQLVWIVYAGNTEGIIQHGLSCVSYYNLSFSADADT